MWKQKLLKHCIYLILCILEYLTQENDEKTKVIETLSQAMNWTRWKFPVAKYRTKKDYVTLLREKKIFMFQNSENLTSGIKFCKDN